MSITGKIGKLLTTIDNAVITIFEDNACVTVIAPSSTYVEDGVLLNIVVEILKFNYIDDEYKVRKNLFNEIIYNPSMFSEYTLSKVNIKVVEHERL